ncbi:MAG: helix-turn-helix domain-containing protein [archaeon]
MGISNIELFATDLIKKSKLDVFNAEDIVKLAGFKKQKVYNILKGLNRKGLVIRLKAGKYVLADSPESDFKYYTAAFAPAYVSLWSALAYHGLTEQIPQKIHLVSTKHQRSIPRIELHISDKNLFTGYENYGFPIATVEKTVFDLLWFNQINFNSLREILQKTSVNKRSFAKFIERISSHKKRIEMCNKLKKVGLVL